MHSYYLEQNMVFSPGKSSILAYFYKIKTPWLIISCIKHLHISFCTHFGAFWCILTHSEHLEQNVENFNLKNSNFFGWKWPIFFLSAQNASICIRMHQNVCRMKCANVLCTKISKNGFILHFKGLKSAKYFLHFVMEDPVSKHCAFKSLTTRLSVRSVGL